MTEGAGGRVEKRSAFRRMNSRKKPQQPCRIIVVNASVGDLLLLFTVNPAV
jgi:hypothetical protein